MISEQTKAMVKAALKADKNASKDEVERALIAMEPQRGLPDTELYSLTEIAKHTRFSRRALENRVARGQFPEPVIVGGRNFYKRADVSAFIRGIKRADLPIVKR
jgi:predicted DNA-binding transcriptional regulator AlpA